MAANFGQTVGVGATDELFAGLRRYPDVESANLVAVDGADRLILDLAAADCVAAGDGRVAVIDDAYGALTLGAAALGVGEIRVHQDAYTGELALANNADSLGFSGVYRGLPLGPKLLMDARVVLLRMPRSLAALAEIADAIARYADSAVRVYAGGRDKHLSKAMNATLTTSFDSVQASLGRQKSRVLVASGPRPAAAPPFPVRAPVEIPDGPGELTLDVVAHGAAFAGPRLDIGTRFLLEHLGSMRADARTAVDLGCGTGILAVALAKRFPELAVTATDQSAAAVASARATAEANGVADRITVARDDALGAAADASADLIVCNPPFHVGAAVHTGAAVKMFRSAGRALRSGGEMWTVYNGHLRYRGVLERLVGPTDIVARNRKFVVTRSIPR
ncbi:MAG: methyltransferase [Mycobacteriaceae bacterium]|nr:methyltransferase [Mycobacteriaceae bacterium]